MRIPRPFPRHLRVLCGLTVWSAAIVLGLWFSLNVADSHDATGIALIKEHRIAASELGRLVELRVTEGQRVRPGQVIARLETNLIEREISVAQAQLQEATSSVQAAGASLDVNALQAERSFQSEMDAVRIELESARSEFARDGAEFVTLRQEIEREQDLVKRGLTRNDRLSQLGMRRVTLEESVRNWPPRIRAIESRQQAASERFAAWRRTNATGPSGPRTAQLRPAEDRVRRQRESMRLLHTRLDQTVLVASAEGYISAILARPGTVLRPGDPVVTLVETQPREVVAYLEEHRGAGIPIGTEVIVHRRNATRDQVRGTVASLSSAVAELPRRLWLNPAIPLWGRAVYINVSGQVAFDPGEMLDVRLSRRAGSVNRFLATVFRTGMVDN
jgi:HlyD family secretion protein